MSFKICPAHPWSFNTPSSDGTVLINPVSIHLPQASALAFHPHSAFPHLQHKPRGMPSCSIAVAMAKYPHSTGLISDHTCIRGHYRDFCFSRELSKPSSVFPFVLTFCTTISSTPVAISTNLLPGFTWLQGFITEEFRMSLERKMKIAWKFMF